MAVLVRAGAGDGARVDAALRKLAEAMGDPFRASLRLVAQAVCGPNPVARALIAVDGGDVGIVVWSPFLSTTRGMAGAYVSDLWVADAARGHGLGQRLLAGVRDAMATEWGDCFLRLAVYDDNPDAGRFYKRLGFTAKPDEIWMTLEGAPLGRLG